MANVGVLAIVGLADVTADGSGIEEGVDVVSAAVPVEGEAIGHERLANVGLVGGFAVECADERDDARVFEFWA